MSNLLEKASIITTPTAYSNGFIHSVKPSESPYADFTFTRNSEATRVNSQGLVESVQILGSNVVTNGDFATNADWTAGDGWSFGVNKASCDGTQTSNTGLIQTISTNIQNQLVKISFTLDISAGTLSGSLNNTGGAEFNALTISGNYSVEATSTDVNPTILFLGDPNFIGSISNVVIEPVTDDTNLPRINYENGCGSWLLEPQTTNLITYSEDFSQWTLGGDTTIESGYLAPDGTNNAYKISGTDNNIKLTVANLLGTSQRTIFARTVSGTGTAKLLTHRNNTNNLFSITEQWQRFKINSTTVSSSNSTLFGIDFRGGSLSEIIIWGANATNNQDFGTSYIPSRGSTRTRNQDLATNAGSSDLISSTEGVLYAEIAALANDGTYRILSLNDGSAGKDNRVYIQYTNVDNTLSAVVKSVDGTTRVNKSVVLTDSTDFHKIAFKYKANDFSLWVNGTEHVGTPINGGGVPSGLNRLSFNDGLANNFFGKAKCVAVFKEALTDAELTALTS